MSQSTIPIYALKDQPDLPHVLRLLASNSQFSTVHLAHMTWVPEALNNCCRVVPIHLPNLHTLYISGLSPIVLLPFIIAPNLKRLRIRVDDPSHTPGHVKPRGRNDRDSDYTLFIQFLSTHNKLEQVHLADPLLTPPDAAWFFRSQYVHRTPSVLLEFPGTGKTWADFLVGSPDAFHATGGGESTREEIFALIPKDGNVENGACQVGWVPRNWISDFYIVGRYDRYERSVR